MRHDAVSHVDPAVGYLATFSIHRDQKIGIAGDKSCQGALLPVEFRECSDYPVADV